MTSHQDDSNRSSSDPRSDRVAVASLGPDAEPASFLMLLGYDEVKAAARDWSTFTSATPGRVPIPNELDVRSMAQLPIESDPPMHTKYRDAVSGWFSKRRVEGLAPEIRQHGARLIDVMVDRGGGEVVGEMAVPFVMQSLATFLGRPETEAEMWASWGRHAFLDNPDGSLRANEALDAYLERVVDEARTQPGDDFFGLLATTTIDDKKLTREEMLGFANLVFAGGRATVIDSISGTMRYLGEHPADMRRLVEDQNLIPQALEEFLRYFSPLAHIGRTAQTDTDVAGSTVAEGHQISLGFYHANRDESAFPRAHEVDINRRPNRHIAFGHGPHTCVGAHLARLELRVFFEELLLRAPNYRVSQPPVLRDLNLGFETIPAGIETLHIAIDDA